MLFVLHYRGRNAISSAFVYYFKFTLIIYDDFAGKVLRFTNPYFTETINKKMIDLSRLTIALNSEIVNDRKKF